MSAEMEEYIAYINKMSGNILLGLDGFVDETMMFGPALRLTTEIRTAFDSGKITITETVTNLGDNPVEHQMLYHINYGEPLLEDFPCFTLWKNTAGEADGYVTGLEPATSYPNSRRFERDRGRVISLEGGESRTTVISIETLEDEEAVAAAEEEIRELQATVERVVHAEPQSNFSG